MTQQAIVTVGCSGSGKSSWADSYCRFRQEAIWVKVERDAARASLFPQFTNGGEVDWTLYKFTKNREKQVTEYCDQEFRIAFEKGRSVIVSDTNLNPKTRKSLIEKLETMGFEVSVKDFPCDLKELYKRNAQRLGGVPNDVVYKQYLQWLDYAGAWKYIPDRNLPDAIVFDIDGTLAKMGDRSPFGWAKVGIDYPRQEIIDMLFGYQGNSFNYNIVIASGRDGCCEEATQNWLRSHGISWDDFYIRPKGDTRPDYVVKEEMLLDMKEKWNVVAWVDDRKQVSDHLRLLGVNIICVGDPHFDF